MSLQQGEIQQESICATREHCCRIWRSLRACFCALGPMLCSLQN